MKRESIIPDDPPPPSRLEQIGNGETPPFDIDFDYDDDRPVDFVEFF